MPKNLRRDNYHKILVHLGHEFNNWGLVLGVGARFRNTSEYTVRELMPIIEAKKKTGIPAGLFPYPSYLYPAYPYAISAKYEEKLMFRGEIYKTLGPLYVSGHFDRYGRKNSYGGSMGLNIKKVIEGIKNIFIDKD